MGTWPHEDHVGGAHREGREAAVEAGTGDEHLRRLGRADEARPQALRHIYALGLAIPDIRAAVADRLINLAADLDIDVKTLGGFEPDGQSLTLSSVGTPGHGAASVSSGKARYNVDNTYTGVDTFTYTVSDGNGGTDIGNVSGSITPVNDPPVADDEIFVVPEDGSAIIDVLDGDTDLDGKLDVNEEWTYSASYTLTQDDLDGKGGVGIVFDLGEPRPIQSALLTFDGTQHTVVFQGNNCVDQYAGAYLVELTLPPPGASC